MLPNTHGYISKKVYQYVQYYHGITLNEVSLKLGSIKPDFVPSLTNIPHYFDDSIAYIVEEISTLSKMKFVNSDKFIKAYSERLGVIIHFICDYFCEAHNEDILKTNLMKHFFYELELNNYIREFNSYIKAHDPRKYISPLLDSDMKTYLYNRINLYNSLNPYILKDLLFALETSTIVVLSILNSSLEKKLVSTA